MSCFWQVCRGQLLATPAYSLHLGQLQKLNAKFLPLPNQRKNQQNFLEQAHPEPDPSAHLSCMPVLQEQTSFRSRRLFKATALIM